MILRNSLSFIIPPKINVQNAFRAMSFLAETSVFAYLGMAIFSFQHKLVPSFLIWTIILILIGRAVNIFPISWFLNNFRETRITRKMQFVMWFRWVLLQLRIYYYVIIFTWRILIAKSAWSDAPVAYSGLYTTIFPYFSWQKHKKWHQMSHFIFSPHTHNF